MEKELLKKIYTLRKIKPDSGFVLSTKENIMERASEKDVKESNILQNPLAGINIIRELSNYLKVPVNNRAAFSTVFAFVIVFTFVVSSSFPVTHDYNNNLPQNVYQKIAVETAEETEDETEEEVKVVAKDNDNNRDAIEAEKPVERQFTALESNLRRVQKEVLGMIIKEDPAQELTDKEIADYIAKGIESSKSNTTESGIGIMQIETKETKENTKLDEAMKIYDAEDYEEFIHTVLDILNTEQLLDILSE